MSSSTTAWSRFLTALVLVCGSFSLVLVAGGADAAPAFKVSLSASSVTPAVGERVRFSGRVTPAAPRKRVQVQGRAAGTGWVTIARPRLSKRSTYNASFAFPRAGRVSIRVVKPRSRNSAQGISSVRHLVVGSQRAPVITTTTLPNAFVGTPYSATVQTADQRPGTFTIAQGSLPAGLTIDAQDGEIKGTPTTLGTSEFTVRFRDADGFPDIQPLSISVVSSGVPAISTTELPNGRVSTPYSATLQTVGNRTGTWALVSGSLPNPLTLNSATGVISGTPSAAGTSSFTVRFTETASGFTDAQPLSIRIAAANGPVISTTSLPPAIVGAGYSATVHTVNNESGTWTSNGLPGGLTLNATTGVISGTPQAPNTPNPPTFTVTFTRPGGLLTPGLSDTQPLKIKINPTDPPIIAASTLPDGIVGAPYSVTLRTVDDRSGTWSLVSGSLPSGLSLNGTDGEITGVPGGPVGTSSFAVRFTALNGLTDTRAFSIRITT